MRTVVYHRKAQRYMRKMPPARKEQLKAAVREVAALEDPLTHPNVRLMRGNREGCMRLRVGDYRAIFHTLEDSPNPEILEVLTVGSHGDIYDLSLFL